MPLSKIFMVFVGALAALALITIVLKVGYKFLNWFFSRRKDPMEPMRH